MADDSRSIWTLEECERMTREQLMNRLRDLGLPGRLFLKVYPLLAVAARDSRSAGGRRENSVTKFSSTR